MGKHKKSDASVSAQNSPTSGAGAVPEKQEYMTRDDILKLIQGELRSMLGAQFSSSNSKLDELGTSMSFISKQYEEIKKGISANVEKIQELLEEKQILNKTINALSDRIRTMEQYMRESNIEINGIPEHKNEILPNVIEQLAKVVENPLDEQDIIFCKRVAKINRESKSPRAVVVKLRSSLRRDALLAATTRFNKKNPQDKLHSHHLGMGGDKSPVFLNEHLSPESKSLHAETRKMAKLHGYKYTWVRNGHIYIRKDETCTHVHIRNFEVLKSVFKQ